MKEKKLLDRAAFLPSYWQDLRHIVLSLAATGHVSIPADRVLKLGLILAAVHQAGVHLLVTLLPSFPLLLLSKGQTWNCMKVCRNMLLWTRDTRDKNVSPVTYRK